jgi:hypothetical protein
MRRMVRDTDSHTRVGAQAGTRAGPEADADPDSDAATIGTDADTEARGDGAVVSRPERGADPCMRRVMRDTDSHARVGTDADTACSCRRTETDA